MVSLHCNAVNVSRSGGPRRTPAVSPLANDLKAAAALRRFLLFVVHPCEPHHAQLEIQARRRRD